MKRILGFLFVMLIPGFSFAVDTPTPTATSTNTPRQNANGDAIRVLRGHMTTVLPTAIPTAFITPAHVVNTGIKYQKISVINNSDCDVVISYDGTNADDIVLSKSAMDDNLAQDGRYFQGSIYLRGQSACSSGNVYITERY